MQSQRACDGNFKKALTVPVTSSLKPRGLYTKIESFCVPVLSWGHSQPFYFFYFLLFVNFGDDPSVVLQ